VRRRIVATLQVRKPVTARKDVIVHGACAHFELEFRALGKSVNGSCVENVGVLMSPEAARRLDPRENSEARRTTEILQVR
jgi:hypothetical protein